MRSRGCITLAASVHQTPWASTGVLSISLRVRVSGDVQIQLLASPHDLPDGRQDLIARYCFNTSALPTETLIPLNAKAVRGAGCERRFWVGGLSGASRGSQVDVLRPAVVDVERFEMHLLLENPARIKEPEWVLCPSLCAAVVRALTFLALRHVCRSVRGMDDRTPQLTSLRKYNLRGLEADYLGAPG